MTTENQVPQKASFGRRLWLALKNLAWFVFRFVLVVLIIAAIGVAVYYGGSVLINEYILKDVRANRSKIEGIQTQIETDSKLITSRLGDFQSRIDALELHQDTITQSISDLEAILVSIEDTLSDHSDMLTNMEVFSSTLNGLTSSVSMLETQVSTIESSLDEYQDELNDKFTLVDLTFESNQEEIDALSIQLNAMDTTDILRQELKLLKVMELITRARVSIGQENIGLAKNDLQAAQEILTLLQSEVDSEQADYLNEISLRLSKVIDKISKSPKLADEDLEVAWQMLLQGLPDESPSGEGKTTQEVEIEVTATPTPSPTPEP